MSNTTPENPLAFPYSGDRDVYGRAESPMGMDLRDYFAAKIASGFVANDANFNSVLRVSGSDPAKAFVAISKASYQLSDAMLAERAKGAQQP